MKTKIKILVWLITFVFVGTAGFPQAADQALDAAASRQAAITKLENSINEKLVEQKGKLPARYKHIWAHNLPEQDFADLQSLDLERYNLMINLKEAYIQGLKELTGKYPDVELDALEKKYQPQFENYYKKVGAELTRNVGGRTLQRFAKEFEPKAFVATDFASIEYFTRNKGLGNAVIALQNKLKPEWEKIQQAYAAEKAALLEKREAIRQEAAAEFEKTVDEKKSDDNKGFWDDFAIGFKGGLNFSTGSEGGDAESAPVIGMVFDYTFLRIPAIAFETALELNINYIQRPVTISEGVINTDYVNVPLFAKAKFPANIPLGFGKFSPFIGIGFDPYFRLSSNFSLNSNGENYVYDSKGVNFAFVWNLGGEFDLGMAGVFSVEFRMSLGASSGIEAYTVPLTPVIGHDVNIPEQKQNGYMIFIGWKIAPGAWF